MARHKSKTRAQVRREAKTMQQSIRFSPSLWRAIESLADANGVSAREQVRCLCDEGLRDGGSIQERRQVIDAALDRLEDYRNEIRRIGQNINQVTMLLHVGEVTEADAQRYEEATAELRPLIGQAAQEVKEAIRSLT